MKELDAALIKLFKKQSKDVSDKDIIPIDGTYSFKKVAFDMFKVYGDHYDGLWKIEDLGGVPHLVRASDPKFTEKKTGEWSASLDYDCSNITLSYKNIPVTSFSSKEFGYSKDDANIFKQALLEKVEEDSYFVKSILSNQGIEKLNALSGTFPELKNLYLNKE